ncbi:tRNA (guanosine(46)-N7)-methyltransferase TrmB [Spirulina subsalsa]|uniref:tRNA (guanosine(46)-N7)-methyltransferase TrmB n=1 Tax=Spirulina subsalsa TaxID=54311 RepID=UPI0038B41686
MARVRVRQHVNPLSRKYQQPITPPPWEQVFQFPQQPLHLDIGCARGRFLLELAPLQLDWNFLGLEIREPLVIEANQKRDQAQLHNLAYLFSNINIDAEILLQSLPEGVLQRVSIQFPDPWFKQRQSKRRVVQPELVGILAQYLPVGGEVFLQSDLEGIAVEMRDRFQEHPAFHLTHSTPWLQENPLPVTTERERATLAKSEPVYRCWFERV